jgi:hypothetical protein
MAGLKPAVNLFALLDRNDAGDKRPSDFKAAKNTAAPAAPPAAPTARDHVIRQNQREKQAKARKRADARATAKSAAAASTTDGNASKVKGDADGAKRGGYNNSGSSRQLQQSGTPGGYNNSNGAPRTQQPGAAVNKVPSYGVQAPPTAKQAPPSPPTTAVQDPPSPPAAIQFLPPRPPILCDWFTQKKQIQKRKEKSQESTDIKETKKEVNEVK